MKKLLSLLLVLALLLPAAAWAEGEGARIRQLPQDKYMSATLVDPACYPEIVLTTGDGYFHYGRDTGDAVPWLCFPGPEGARPAIIQPDSVRYLDVDRGIQYSYVLYQKAYYEEFTENVENEAWILRDGSDKTAACVDPERDRAGALIGVPVFGRTAKLQITIDMDDLDRDMGEAEKAEILSGAILAELDRVKGVLRTEERDPHWNEGLFEGIDLLCAADAAYVLPVDFPVLTEGEAQAKMVVIEVDSNTVEGAWSFPSGASMRAELEMSTYAYAAEKLAGGDENALTMTLENGSEWTVYFSYPDSDGSSGNVYAARVIPTPAGISGDKPFCATLKLTGDKMQWNRETLPALLQVFDAAMTIPNE